MTTYDIVSGPTFTILNGQTLSTEAIATEAIGDSISLMVYNTSGQAVGIQGNRAIRDGEAFDAWDDIGTISIANDTIGQVDVKDIACIRIRLKAASAVSGDKNIPTSKQIVY